VIENIHLATSDWLNQLYNRLLRLHLQGKMAITEIVMVMMMMKKKWSKIEDDERMMTVVVVTFEDNSVDNSDRVCAVSEPLEWSECESEGEILNLCKGLSVL